ncbi:DbpA RNA binding domain-containing protein [Candidatus Palauibacter sp.]|uniref:DbpA RNA binding domain-containing protein n=1 Tax=Candidatus Palauibacter sp. TaxID=3101350 RepID=UPI003B5BA19C
MSQDQSEDSVETVAAPEALEALAAAVERGRHLALVAAEGAGLAQLYAAAATRDLESAAADGRVFVLTASVDRARRCAARMYEAVREAGHNVVIVAPGSTPDAAHQAPVLVGPPAPLLEAVRKGDIPASAICTLILDDVRALEPARAAVEAILQASDEGARRIATTHARDAAFDELIVRRLPRARRWPNELFGEPGATAPGAGRVSGGPIAVASRATRAGRLARLAELLHDIARADAGTAVSVETAPAAIDEVRAALSVAGIDVPAAGVDHPVRIGAWGQVEPAPDAVVLGLPPTPALLARAVEGADRCYAIVDTLHERQLELTVARAGRSVTPLAERADPDLMDEVAAFRARVSEAIEQQDLASGALLLAPLIEAHGAPRVAGALAGLLRATDRADTSAEAPATDRPAPRSDASAERATRPTWTRVFVGVGKRDDAGPGDLVGAITGETGAAGGQIGRIDIRQNFTLVDVDSLVADEVVRGLDGRMIKGRQVVARLDRGAARG